MTNVFLLHIKMYGLSLRLNKWDWTKFSMTMATLTMKTTTLTIPLKHLECTNWPAQPWPRAEVLFSSVSLHLKNWRPIAPFIPRSYNRDKHRRLLSGNIASNVVQNVGLNPSFYSETVRASAAAGLLLAATGGQISSRHLCLTSQRHSGALPSEAHRQGGLWREKGLKADKFTVLHVNTWCTYKDHSFQDFIKKEQLINSVLQYPLFQRD